jgi:hypothetical protein
LAAKKHYEVLKKFTILASFCDASYCNQIRLQLKRPKLLMLLHPEFKKQIMKAFCYGFPGLADTAPHSLSECFVATTYTYVRTSWQTILYN